MPLQMNAGSMAGRVGKAGEAIGEHLQSARAATAAAGQAKKVLGYASARHVEYRAAP